VVFTLNGTQFRLEPVVEGTAEGCFSSNQLPIRIEAGEMYLPHK
jgi:hypothetical protein